MVFCRRAVALLAASLAAAFGAAACGDASGTGAGSGASLAPASAVAFASFDTDVDSDQWAAAAALLRKFPSGDELIDDLVASFDVDDADFARDIAPALGPELDVVVLDEDAMVALTQPADPAALQDLVARGDDPGVATELEDGWWAVAEQQAELDRYEQARERSSLSSDDAYQSATKDLPSDALVRLYVNGGKTAGLAGGPVPGLGHLAGCGGSESGSFGLAVTAEDDGLRIDGSGKAGPSSDGGSGVWNGSDTIPAGALAFVTVHGLGAQARSYLDCAAKADDDFGTYLGGAQLALGVDIEKDLLPLFDNETSLVLYPSGMLPGTEVRPGEPDGALLVNHGKDDADVLDLLDGIVGKAGMFGVGVELGRSPVPDTTGLEPIRELRVDGEPELYYASDGGTLILAPSKAVVVELVQGSDDALSTSAPYKAALERAEVNTSEANALVYVDVPAFRKLAAEQGDDEAKDLEPLGPLVVTTRKDGDRVTVQGFLQID